MWYHKLLCVWLIIPLVISPSQGRTCSSETTCADCISHAGCAWCSAENFDQPRCNTKDQLIVDGCLASNISNPRSYAKNTKETSLGPTVQVMPQEVTLKLRPGDTVRVDVKVQPAEDFPVDLYYLMDMSNSMKDDLTNLKTLATKIAESMQSITKNFRLGFGSFVDKTVSPFLRTELKLPCQDCEASYGYKHILKLVKDEKKFEEEVNKQIISGNLDEPEGGFDALMQVATCINQIGWGDAATHRRLVIFVSDAPFHVAGDGRLGGIVTRNDGKCHLENGLYIKSNDLDYPSVAHLKTKLLESQIQPIFAVTKTVIGVYEDLSLSWAELGAVAGALANDSSNIVNLIEDSYRKIVSTVKLSYKAPDGIRVEHIADCGNLVSEDGGCNNVKLGQTVSFSVGLTLEQCNVEQQKDKSMTIRVPGFGSVVLNLEYICECQCEQPGFKEDNSSKCTGGNGTYACGQCACNKGRYGDICECSSAFDKAQDESKCRVNNASKVACSGNGQCVCGKCVCNRDSRGRIYGDKCQCNDFSCDEFEAKICGGPERGSCDCGECLCKGVYTGANCGQINCPEVERKCKDDKGSICGGKGSCECGECRCDNPYSGTYCEECHTCEGGTCSRVHDCIKCTMFDSNSLEDCKKSNRCESDIHSVNAVDDISKYSDATTRCDAVDGDQCTYFFTFKKRLDGETSNLYLQKEKVCPKKAPVMWIVIGVVLGILLVGLLLLLIFKLLVTMVDRLEYQKFERDRMRSKWHREKNPIYKEAKSTFENPTYAGGK